jgi:hypothetical protein
MLTETMLVKVEGAAQASQFSGLAGKSYTVGKVSSVGAGMNNWLFLNPLGKTGAETVAVKLEGARQTSQFAGLAGKSVTVGKSPTVIGGMSKWVVLTPFKGVAAGVGVAGVGAAKLHAVDSSMLMMKVEGAQQASQIPALAGKKFTVMKAPMMGTKANGWLFLKPAGAGASLTEQGIVALKTQNGAAASSQISSIVGKTFTIGKAPITTGNAAGKWLLLKPAISSSIVKGGAAASTAVIANESLKNGAATKKMAVKGAAAKGSGAGGVVDVLKIPTESTINNRVATEGTVSKSAVTKGGLTKGAASKAATNGAATTGKTLVGKSTLTAGVGSGVKGVATTGTIWKGTGLSLGLGLGLGAWGSVILAGAAVATGVGIYSYMKNRESDINEIDEYLS